MESHSATEIVETIKKHGETMSRDERRIYYEDIFSGLKPLIDAIYEEKRREILEVKMRRKEEEWNLWQKVEKKRAGRFLEKFKDEPFVARFLALGVEAEVKTTPPKTLQKMLDARHSMQLQVCTYEDIFKITFRKGEEEVVMSVICENDDYVMIRVTHGKEHYSNSRKKQTCLFTQDLNLVEFAKMFQSLGMENLASDFFPFMVMCYRMAAFDQDVWGNDQWAERFLGTQMEGGRYKKIPFLDPYVK